jgi:hypothetical protein
MAPGSMAKCFAPMEAWSKREKNRERTQDGAEVVNAVSDRVRAELLRGQGLVLVGYSQSMWSGKRAMLSGRAIYVLSPLQLAPGKNGETGIRSGSNNIARLIIGLLALAAVLRVQVVLY